MSKYGAVKLRNSNGFSLLTQPTSEILSVNSTNHPKRISLDVNVNFFLVFYILSFYRIKKENRSSRNSFLLNGLFKE